MGVFPATWKLAGANFMQLIRLIKTLFENGDNSRGDDNRGEKKI